MIQAAMAHLSGRWFVVWIGLALAAILLITSVFPLLETIKLGFSGGPGSVATLMSGATFRALTLSVMISLGSVLGAGVIGTALGVLLTRFQFSGSRVLEVIAVLPMALPPLIGAVSFYLLYGESGVVPRLLAGLTGLTPATFAVTGVAGVLLVHCFTLYPYFYLAVRVGLVALDTSVEEAAFNLGASRSRVWRTILLPMLTPALISGSLLTFMVSMASFTAPQLYDVPMLTMTIVSARISGAHELAAAQSTLLSAVSVAFLLAMRWYQNRTTHRSASKGAVRAARPLGSPRMRIAAALLSIAGTAILVAPVAIILLVAFTVDGSWTLQVLPTDYTFSNFVAIFESPRALRPVLVSLETAFVAATACLIVGGAAAWLIARSGRAIQGFGEVMIMLPWALPGTVVGINLVTAFASPTPFNMGQVLVGSAWILPVAYFVRFMPLVFRSTSAAFQSVDPSLEEAAKNLGASQLSTIARVTLPLVWRGALAGFLMAFVQGIGEYVASTVIYPARFAPLSVEIYNRLYSNEFGTAAAFGALQIALILALVALSQRLERQANGALLPAAGS